MKVPPHGLCLRQGLKCQPRENPEFATVLKVMHVLGLKLSVQATTVMGQWRHGAMGLIQRSASNRAKSPSVE